MPGPDRPAALQNFIDATLGVMTAFAIVPEAQRALGGIRPAASRVAPPSGRKPGHQPACRHLEAGLAQSAADPRLAPLVAAFRAAEPLLEWTTDPPSGDSPEGDPENYAEITIFGPGGYEERDDIWLGLSLLAPGFRYPDHQHSPEEVYLVLSEGDFWREGSGWFTPGIGGTFYNQPSVRHAMRAGAQPLLAIWALRRV